MEERKPRRRLARGLITFIVILTVLVSALSWVTWIPLRRARAEWRDGRVAEAISQTATWSRLRIWPNQYRQMLAAAHLTVGNRAAAQEQLQGLRGKTLWLSVVRKPEVASRLFARGRHQQFLEYDAAFKSWFEPADTVLYRAAALASISRFDDAQSVLRDLDRDDVDAQKLSALERAMAQREEGTFPLAVDRQGRTIAAYHFANRDVVAVNTDFQSLVEREAGQLTIENWADRGGATDTIELTLDAAVQKAALNALGGFRGALVAIDPKTHEILALASSRGRGALSNLALEQQYEPGSVIKVLTGMSAFANNVNVTFPYTCTGELLIDGRHFGDWLTAGHGTLPDFEEAMARSCNVVFADLGVRLGAQRLRDLMTRAGFDGQTDLGLFRAPLGRTVGNIFNNFETALYAIGLEHETSSTLHVAMLAEMMANRGVLSRPVLLRARRTILGERLRTPAPGANARVVAPEIANRMIAAMVSTVTRDEGTGRRADIDGVSLALKTGTAGKREEGYHAIIMAFAPVEQPKVAFALIAENSGPAEYAGAKIAHDFLAAIADRLR
jgi:penicillin-binding protein A